VVPDAPNEMALVVKHAQCRSCRRRQEGRAMTRGTIIALATLVVEATNSHCATLDRTCETGSRRRSSWALHTARVL